MGCARAAGPLIVCGCLATLTSGSANEPPLDQGPSTHQRIVQDADGFRLESNGEKVHISGLTAYCVGCHCEIEGGGDHSDGTAAIHTSHPVDVPYPEGNPDYVPVADLDPILRLVRGNLSCLTCHDPQADRVLVIPLEEGKLCLACHRN